MPEEAHRKYIHDWGGWETWRINNITTGQEDIYSWAASISLWELHRRRQHRLFSGKCHCFLRSRRSFLSVQWSCLVASCGSQGLVFIATPWPRKSSVSPQDLFVFQLVAEHWFKSLFMRRHRNDMTSREQKNTSRFFFWKKKTAKVTTKQKKQVFHKSSCEAKLRKSKWGDEQIKSLWAKHLIFTFKLLIKED